MPCLAWYYNNCAKVTYNYVGILLALMFQEDYSIQQNSTTVAKTITEKLKVLYINTTYIKYQT